MNREILFRGKRADTKEWIYGDVQQNVDAVKIREQEPNIQRIAKSFEVIPETVGQFTGVTDNGGKKIFEGDIIRFTHFMVSDRLYVVEWNQESAMFHLKCSGCDSKYEQEAFDTNFEYTSRKHFEIVGNIHDNTELLEVSGMTEVTVD